jgi:hypothetical protein
MARHNKRSFRERLASTFENGFGDEGVLAKVVYAVIVAFLVIISAVIGVFMVPLRLIKRFKRLVTRSVPQPPPSDTSAS